MAGLLNIDFNDPETAGLLGLAGGLFAAGAPSSRRIGTGQALMMGLQGMQQGQMGAREYAQQQELMRRKMAGQDLEMQMGQMRLGGMQQEASARKAAQEFQSKLPEIIRQYGNDYQGMIRDYPAAAEYIKQVAEARNLGRSKVARTLETEGADGQKIVLQLDENGDQVGQGMPGYVAPQLVDQGGKSSFVKPTAGLSFTKTLSPSDQAANARAYAQMAQSDRHFLGNQDLKRQEIGMKREEKQQEATQAKAGQVASFDTMLDSLDRIKTHPGLSRSVGLYSKIPSIPSSDSSNFQAELETFQSQAFLPMVSQLKGMGALSDAEGKKLTAAVGALNPKMSESAFKESLNRIQKDMEAARQRAIQNTNLPSRKTAPASTGNQEIDNLLLKYGGQ